MHTYNRPRRSSDINKGQYGDKKVLHFEQFSPNTKVLLNRLEEMIKNSWTYDLHQFKKSSHQKTTTICNRFIAIHSELFTTRSIAY